MESRIRYHGCPHWFCGFDKRKGKSANLGDRPFLTPNIPNFLEQGLAGKNAACCPHLAFGHPGRSLLCNIISCPFLIAMAHRQTTLPLGTRRSADFSLLFVRHKNLNSLGFNQFHHSVFLDQRFLYTFGF